MSDANKAAKKLYRLLETYSDGGAYIGEYEFAGGKTTIIDGEFPLATIAIKLIEWSRRKDKKAERDR